MAKRDKNHTAYQGPTDGTYDELNTPLNVQKDDKDPQVALDNGLIPCAKGERLDDPMGYLEDLTGPRGRRGDPV